MSDNYNCKLACPIEAAISAAEICEPRAGSKLPAACSHGFPSLSRVREHCKHAHSSKREPRHAQRGIDAVIYFDKEGLNDVFLNIQNMSMQTTDVLSREDLDTLSEEWRMVCGRCCGRVFDISTSPHPWKPSHTRVLQELSALDGESETVQTVAQQLYSEPLSFTAHDLQQTRKVISVVEECLKKHGHIQAGPAASSLVILPSDVYLNWDNQGDL